jgi:DNA segregation ATPase FtsK/SpoIIIE-like protein
MAKKKKSNYLEINEFEPISNTTDAIESEIIATTDSDEEEIMIQYDGTWKLVIEEFYLDFMEFFLPDLFAVLDTSVAPEFLNQELLTIQKELNVPKQITDRLIKVQLLDGTQKWVLVHIEIQTKFEIQFSTRMYLYQSFIYAKHRLPITALAIFTTAQTPKYFNVYKVESFGTKSYYHYNAYRIAKQVEADLIASPNIFSLFVLAHLYVIKTTPKKYEERFAFKEKLYALAEKKGISEKKIGRMLIFVDEIIALPLKFQIAYMKKIKIPNRSASELAVIASMQRKAKEWFPDSFYAHKGMTIEAYEALQERERETERQLAEAEIRKIEQKAAQKTAKIEQKVEKAEAEKQKAEAEKQKAEAEKQKAEAEKQKAEAEKQKAEAEKQKAEAEKWHQQIGVVIALHEQAHFDALKIAAIQQSTVAEVEYILEMYQQKKLSMPEMIGFLKVYQEQIKGM